MEWKGWNSRSKDGRKRKNELGCLFLGYPVLSLRSDSLDVVTIEDHLLQVQQPDQPNDYTTPYAHLVHFTTVAASDRVRTGYAMPCHAMPSVSVFRGKFAPGSRRPQTSASSACPRGGRLGSSRRRAFLACASAPSETRERKAWCNVGSARRGREASGWRLWMTGRQYSRRRQGVGDSTYGANGIYSMSAYVSGIGCLFRQEIPLPGPVLKRVGVFWP